MSNLSELTTPASLEDLFKRDPLKLTDNDIQRIVDELRTKRQTWAAEEDLAKVQQRRPKASAGIKVKAEPKGKVDLSQLKIEL